MEELVFSKYTNNRKAQYSIITSIYQDELGEKWVEKRATSKLAQAHIDSLMYKYNLLRDTYDSLKLNIVPAKKSGLNMRFKYIEGELFSNRLINLIEQDKYKEFIEQIKEYLGWLQSENGIQDFKISKEFQKIFGTVEFDYNVQAIAVANIDCTFDNIVLNNQVNVIDYEWVFDFLIPIHYILYRALSVFIIKESVEDKINLVEVCRALGMKLDEIQTYQKMEQHFQSYVGKEEKKVKNKTIPLNELISYKREAEEKVSFQIFEDTGKGFSEEESYRILADKEEGQIYHLKIKCSDKINKIRIDPIEDCCMIQVKSCSQSNNIQVLPVDWRTNGISLNGVVLFTHKDPQLIIEPSHLNQIEAIEIIFKLVRVDIDLTAIIEQCYIEKQKLHELNKQIQQEKESIQKLNRQIQQEKENIQNRLEQEQVQVSSLNKELKLNKEKQKQYQDISDQLVLRKEENINLQKVLMSKEQQITNLEEIYSYYRNKNIALEEQVEALKKEIQDKSIHIRNIESKLSSNEIEIAQIRKKGKFRLFNKWK